MEERPRTLIKYAALAARLLGALVVARLLWGTGKLFYGVTFTHGAKTVVHASFTWGLLLLASFAGWGSALEAWLFPRERADWGLRCAWGWGVAVGIGGVLCVLGIARRAEIFGVTAIGLGLLAGAIARAYVRWSRRPPLRRARLWLSDAPFIGGAASIFVLGLFQMAASIVETSGFNGNDDNIAYFAFAREIIEGGSLTQPFSIRRISAYGGKSLLDAFQLAIDVPDLHLHMLDNGMATLTVLALIYGHARTARVSSRGLLLLAMLATVTLENLRINSTTAMVGVVFFLGLYRTMVWPPVARARGWRSALPVALLAAGACTLRQNYLVPVGIALVVAYGSPIVWGRRLRPLGIDRAACRDAGVALALFVAFLLPWWILTLRWCGTFLFPIAKGNYDPAYSFFRHKKLFEWLHYVWDNVAYCLPVKSTPIFLAAALTLSEWRTRKPLTAITLAAFGGFAMLLHSYSGGSPPDQGRYYFGFTFAAILAISLGAADLAARARTTRRKRAQMTSVPLVVIALSMQIYDERDHTYRLFDGYLNELNPINESPTPWAQSVPDPVYKQLQDAVPAHHPIAVMVDQPGHFNYGRNRVESLDMVGAVSPPPGIPLAGGPEAVAAYLIKAGYRYLIVVHPDASSSLFKRDAWAKLQAAPGPNPWDKMWAESARYYIEAFDDFDRLRETRLKLAETSGITTLDLATMATKAP